MPKKKANTSNANAKGIQVKKEEGKDNKGKKEEGKDNKGKKEKGKGGPQRSLVAKLGQAYTFSVNALGVLAASGCITFACFASSPKDRLYFAGAAFGFSGWVARDLYRGGMTFTNAALTTTTSIALTSIVIGTAFGKKGVCGLVESLAKPIAVKFTDIALRYSDTGRGL